MTKKAQPASHKYDAAIEEQIAIARDEFERGLRSYSWYGEKLVMVLQLDASGLISKFMSDLSLRLTLFKDKLICRRAKVNRRISPQAVLDGMGMKQQIDRAAVKSMPRGAGATATIYFFQVSRGIAEKVDLGNEYLARGLKPADPYSVAQLKVKKDDSEFGPFHEYGTQWQGANGEWFHLCIGGYDPVVKVDRGQLHGGQGFWFAGIRVK